VSRNENIVIQKVTINCAANAVFTSLLINLRAINTATRRPRLLIKLTETKLEILSSNLMMRVGKLYRISQDDIKTINRIANLSFVPIKYPNVGRKNK